MKTGAESGYNSKMSGGASSAASGSSAPPAPAVKAASAGGGGASGSGSGGDKAAKTDPATAPQPGGTAYVPQVYNSAPSEEPDLLRSIAAEKLNGKDANYISNEDAKSVPAEEQLKSGATIGDSLEKYAVSVDSAPDPEDLAGLSRRKTELKKRYTPFLKKVENKYGLMQDIYSTPAAPWIPQAARADRRLRP